MSNYQQSLVELLEEDNLDHLKRDMDLFWLTLSTEQRARFLIDTSFLLTAVKFFQEQFWVYAQKKATEVSFGNFIKKFFKKELKPILFLHSYLENATIEVLEQLCLRIKVLQKIILDNLNPATKDTHFFFACTCVKHMSELFELEYQIKMNGDDADDTPDFLLDRTFDILDDVLGIEYPPEENIQPTKTERLYIDSGIGVQSSYAAILLALRYIRLPKNFRMVDLGSGFGRVGLAAGLMRSDLRFSGFEFVEARVNIANRSADKLGISDRISFKIQDLSDAQFRIPDAEVFYLYDPFTDATYEHVLDQLSELGQKKQITIITKGNARKALENFVGVKPWKQPQLFIHGNFSLFHTRGSH